MARVQELLKLNVKSGWQIIDKHDLIFCIMCLVRGFYIKSLTLTCKYSAILLRVISDGFLLPRSSREMYVLSKPISSASASWLIPFSSLICLNFLPNSQRMALYFASFSFGFIKLARLMEELFSCFLLIMCLLVYRLTVSYIMLCRQAMITIRFLV